MYRPSLQTRGALLLIVTSLFVVQPVVVGVHHLLQPHFFCLEHSAFEHLLGDGTGEGAGGEASALSSASLFSPSEDEHVICPISQQVQTHGRLVAATSANAEMSYESAEIPAMGFAHPSVPLLSYAPKLSPPSSAVALPL